MTTAFRNMGLQSNIETVSKALVPDDMVGETIEIQFPVKTIKSADLANKPLHHIPGYTANQKTMVQNMFNKRNLNENLNFKNTFYLEGRNEQANKESNTVYNHGKVYEKNVVDAGIKAQLASKTTRNDHVKEVKRVKESFHKTTDNVAKLREEKLREEEGLQKQHRKDVKRYFKKVQNLVGFMVTGQSPNKSQEKFTDPDNDDEANEIDVFHIQRQVKDEEAVLNNKANIRTLMGSRSSENQDKVRYEKEEKERIVALEEARKLNLERQEEVKISKYLDLKKLSTQWRIQDPEKLRGTVRNEIMKDVMKEEERKNFEKIAANMKKTTIKDQILKKPTPKPKPKLEPPKTAPNGSPTRKNQKESKKYAFSPDKVAKLPKETQEDFVKRFGFTVMTLPSQKGLIDPVEQHKRTKEFQELLMKNSMAKNGRLILAE